MSAEPDGERGPPTRRPRLLLPLALLGLLQGTIGTSAAWATIVQLTGSHDRFVSAMSRDAAQLVPGVGSADEQRRFAERRAEALWGRRRVLLPLAAAGAISSTLVLLGVTGVWMIERRRAWGRAAWQLGAIVAVPCLVLETVVGYMHSRDLLSAIVDLHDPLSEQLRTLLPLRDRVVLAIAGVQALYLVGAAVYLGTRRVTAWCAASAIPQK